MNLIRTFCYDIVEISHKSQTYHAGFYNVDSMSRGIAQVELMRFSFNCVSVSRYGQARVPAVPENSIECIEVSKSIKNMSTMPYSIAI